MMRVRRGERFNVCTGTAGFLLTSWPACLLAAAAGLRSSRISASSLRVYGTRGRPRSRDPGGQS